MRTRLFLGALSVCMSIAAMAACVGDEPAAVDGSDGGTSAGDGATTTDASSGNDSASSADSGPKNFCDTESAPDGAADFFCADFDETDFARGFLDASDNVTDGSSIGQTSLVFVSPAQALSSDMAATTDVQSAYYEWRQPGAKNVQTVSVSTSVNPTGLPTMTSESGFVFILGIAEGKGGVDLGYAHGATLNDASDYDGYVLREYSTNGLAFSTVFPAGNFPPDTWTKVTLTWDVSTGDVSLFYDGVLASSSTISGQTDTVADVLVGGRTFQNTAAGSWRFDNLEIATMRSP